MSKNNSKKDPVELFVKDIDSPTQATRGLAEKSARGACVLPK